MEPFKSPMVIAICANGDGVLHWRHYVPSPLEPMDRHWHHFFVTIGANGANGENPKSL
jgi:hypothetical protein